MAYKSKCESDPGNGGSGAPLRESRAGGLEPSKGASVASASASAERGKEDRPLSASTASHRDLKAGGIFFAQVIVQ